MRRVVALLLVAAAVPAAAGCGGGDGDDEQGGGGGGAGAQTIQLSATDFEFDPAEISVEPGEVTFELMNDGQSPHALEIEGEGVEEESDTIDPGGSTTLTVELAEGTYEFYCPVGDHAERGMVGTLTVGAAGGGSGETDTGDDGIGGGY